MLDKKREVIYNERMDVKELKQLAMDIVDGKVFGTWNIREADAANLVGMVFMPALFLSEEQRKQLKEADIVHFYEYFDKAGPRAVNGYPMFMSMNSLAREDSVVVFRFCKELEKQRQEFLGEEEKQRPQEQPTLWDET